MPNYSSATITNSTHVHAAKSFIKSFDNEDDPIFAFASKATPWGEIVEDREMPVQASSSYAHTIDAIKNLIFAKPLSSSDVHLSFKRNDWKKDQVYKQWTISQNNIFEMPYVTIVGNDGECNVFMCISNNYGAPSTYKPDIIKSFELQKTKDNYSWRWLFDVNADLMNKWACEHFIPMPQDDELSDSFKLEQQKYITVDYQANINNIDVVDGGLFLSRVLIKIPEGKEEAEPDGIFSYSTPDTPDLRFNLYIKHVKDPKSGASVVETIYEPKIDYVEITEEGVEIIHYVQESIQNGTTIKVDENGQPVFDSNGNAIYVPNIITRDAIFPIPIYHYTISRIELISGGRNFFNTKIVFQSLNESDKFHFIMDNKIDNFKNIDTRPPTFNVIIDPKFVLGRSPECDIGARFVTTKIKFKDTEDMKFPVSIHYRQFGLIKNLRYKNLTPEMVKKYEDENNTTIDYSELINILKIKEPVSYFDIVTLTGVDPNKIFEVKTEVVGLTSGVKGYILYAEPGGQDTNQTIYIGSVEPNPITYDDKFNRNERVESYTYHGDKKTSISAYGYVIEHTKHNVSDIMGDILYIENASNISRVSRQTEMFLLTFEL